MSLDANEINKALRHLRRADLVMGDLIKRAGKFSLKLRRDRFGTLVGSIISQQISTAAARSIRRKLENLVSPGKITAQKLALLSSQQLRSAGVSPQKAGYITDLTEKVQSRQIRLSQVGRWSDERVIEELVQVKGIGRWTAQMFLIFSLGRLDVFPHDDLGVRSAIRDLYQLKDLPDKEQSLKIAAPWHPYASVASWYCWRSRDIDSAGSRKN